MTKNNHGDTKQLQRDKTITEKQNKHKESGFLDHMVEGSDPFYMSTLRHLLSQNPSMDTVPTHTNSVSLVGKYCFSSNMSAPFTGRHNTSGVTVNVLPTVNIKPIYFGLFFILKSKFKYYSRYSQKSVWLLSACLPL